MRGRLLIEHPLTLYYVRVVVSACCSLLSSRKLWSAHMRHMRCCGLLYSFRSVLTLVVSWLCGVRDRSHCGTFACNRGNGFGLCPTASLSQAMLLVACVLHSFVSEWSPGTGTRRSRVESGQIKQADTALRQAAQLRVRTDNTRYSDFKFAGRHQARVRECWGRLVRRGFASGGNVSSQVIDDTRSRRDC